MSEKLQETVYDDVFNIQMHLCSQVRHQKAHEFANIAAKMRKESIEMFLARYGLSEQPKSL